MSLSCIKINPMAHSIDDSNSIGLKDVAKVIDFEIIWDDAARGL